MRAFLLAALLAPSAALANAPSVDEILANLERASKDVHQLEGEFVQRNHVKLFKKEVIAKGSLAFTPPRKLIWRYTEPDPSTLSLDGDTATLTTPGEAPRTFDLKSDATMRAIFDQLLLWMGPGGLGRARDDYELASSGSPAEPSLILSPKPSSPAARAFQRIELRLDGKSWLLRSIVLTEKNGDEKTISFTSLRRR